MFVRGIKLSFGRFHGDDFFIPQLLMAIIFLWNSVNKSQRLVHNFTYLKRQKLKK